MKYYFLSLISVLTIALFFGGCSKLRDNITQPPALTTHQGGNNDTNSVEFHGNMLKANNFDLSSCKQCHGAKLNGGITKVDCSSCHNYPHPANFSDTTKAEFHGQFLRSNSFTLTECAKCHGSDFTGKGSAQLNCKSCHSVYPHDPGFSVASSPAFHGQYLQATSFNLTNCAKCHGSDFTGNGAAALNCKSCHSEYPHIPGYATPNSSTFHGLFLKADNYNMVNCQKCHGNDFAGNGASQANCKSCHTQSAGPLACNTCHGSFSDPSRIAPPRDLAGNNSTDFIAVGSHASHLYTNGISNVACENCHNVPNANNVKDHFTNVPHTIVVLDSLATHGNASNALFNTGSGTCANTYCHGNFQFNKADAPGVNQYAFTDNQMVGNNKTVKWTNLDGSQAPCGSCHGTPDGFISPVGHIKVSRNQCVACHSTVVDVNGNIIDKSKHINGQINYALTKRVK